MLDSNSHSSKTYTNQHSMRARRCSRRNFFPPKYRNCDFYSTWTWRHKILTGIELYVQMRVFYARHRMVASFGGIV